MPITSNPRAIRLHERKFILNKIWNSQVPLCCKRSLESATKCNKYSNMCRKPETKVPKSATIRYNQRGEHGPHSPAPSATPPLWQHSGELLPWMWISSAQYIARASCTGTSRQRGSTDRRRQDASLEGKGRETSPSECLACPERVPWRAVDLRCMSRPQRVAATKCWVLAESISAGTAGWHTRSVTPHSPRSTKRRFSQAKLSHLKCTLTLKQQQKSEKAACTSVSYSSLCSPFVWLTI